MVEIKSPKIEKQELQKQIQNILDEIDFNKKEFQKFKKFKLKTRFGID